MDISIVTGTVNRLPLLQQMMTSARASLPYGCRYEFVICDGGSTDGTLDWLRRQPNVKLIEHGERRGILRAFNDAAFAATGDYVVMANDDIIWQPNSLAAALAYMQTHPTCGVGAIFQRTPTRKEWHVNVLTARRDGERISLPYGQVEIIPRWLGNRMGWWNLKGAKQYGGDTWLSAKLWELGYSTDPIPDARIEDLVHQDEVRATNNAEGVVGVAHPDSVLYYQEYPDGPLVADEPAFEPEPMTHRLRILYAPIYERDHAIQHAQKRSMRRALARVGNVIEVDYIAGESISDVARWWRPDLVLTELHDAAHFTYRLARRVRMLLPNSFLVNWHGDYWPNMADDEPSLDVLRLFDLNTVVNMDMVPRFNAKGVPTRYWQIGYEEAGVGHEPTPTTPAYDVLFMGSAYSPKRAALGRFLRGLRGVKVGLYGHGWHQADGETTYDFETGCRLIRNAKLVVADSQWPEAEGYCSNRTIQSLAAGGALLLQQAFAGMEELVGLVNGQHVVCWRTFADLEANIRYYLEHEAERVEIARAGHAHALQHFSFDARLRELWPMLKVLYAEEELVVA